MPHSYENYDDKSKTYTAMRRPIGAGKMIDHFKQSTVPLADQKLLDAGCGTGNYAVEFIKEYGMHSIRCSDYNLAMVNEARKNHEEKCHGKGDVIFSTDNICELTEVGSESFDCVCNNQVIHHLRGDNDYEDLRKACQEFHRVLKDGGRLTINWSPPKIQMTGMWWAELIPKAQGVWNGRSPSTEKMEECLKAAGFAEVRLEPLLDEILYEAELYGNPENFLDIENFRRSDSTFTLCGDEEIAEAVARIKALKEEGKLKEWFENKEKERKECGQTVTVYCVK